MKKKIKMPEFLRRAEVRPQTLDEEKRTIEVIFSTGARVLRQPLFDEPYYEELSLDPDDVRLERLNNGAPFLKVHDDWELDSVLGVVESAKTDGEIGTAVIRFSERDDVEPFFKDIADGILRHVSVGYRIYKMEMVEQEGEIKTYRATDWEPLELSMVPIGADDGAIVRGKNSHENQCEIITKEEKTMAKTIQKKRNDDTPPPEPPKEDTPPAEDTPPPEPPKEDTPPAEDTPPPEPPKEETPPDEEGVKKEATLAERERAQCIRRTVRAGGLEESFADEMIKKGTSIEETRKLVIDQLADRDQEIKTRTARVEVVKMEEKQIRREGCVNALLYRHDPKANKLDEKGRMFLHLRLLDMAREFIEASGVNTRHMGPDEIIKRAFMHTTDLPEVFADVANKTLLQGYQSAPRTFSLIARQRFVTDFKTIKPIQFAGAFALEKVPESGEVKYGALKDQGEEYKAESFAKTLGLTRKMIIDDDISAFTRLPQICGAAAANMESDVVWELIAKSSGQVMKYDNKALFHTDHGNLAGSGAAISVTTISAGRADMMTQKGFDKKPLNIMPRYLIAPAAKLTAAEQYCAQLNYTDTPANYNPFGGKLIPVGEPRLDGYSGTAWYLAAELNQVDMIETATLVGQDGPIIETFVDPDVLGMKIRVLRDFGARVVEHRGLYKNPGA